MPTEQHPLTVIVPVIPERQEALRAFLEPLGRKVEGNGVLEFRRSPSTHFARLVILPSEEGEDPPAPTRLLFSSNFDGDPHDYTKELVEAVGPALDQVWQHCEGYRRGQALDAQTLQRFIDHHSLPTQAFYAACRGASVGEIRRANALRATLDEALDRQDSLEFDLLRPHLGPGHVAPLPPRAHSAPDPAHPFWHNVADRVFGLDPGEQQISRRPHADPAMLHVEDQVAQNQMTIRSPQRPGFLRWLMVSGVLALAGRNAAHAHGSLSGLTTIHFARWVLVDGGRSILFESNYDGSWENYINDFVDFASLGMDAIWAGAVDFPRGGSRDIEAFKEIIRRYQVPAQLFYSAYPYSTVRNNLYNLRLADALNRPAPNPVVREFTQGLYRWNG